MEVWDVPWKFGMSHGSLGCFHGSLGCFHGSLGCLFHLFTGRFFTPDLIGMKFHPLTTDRYGSRTSRQYPSNILGFRWVLPQNPSKFALSSGFCSLFFVCFFCHFYVWKLPRSVMTSSEVFSSYEDEIFFTKRAPKG